MNRTSGSIHIARPVEVVFNYTCSSGNWPRWYSLTRSVSGVTDRPGQPGEACVEKVRILGIPFTFFWHVTQNESPNRYLYEGTSNVGGRAQICYEFKPAPDGTLFHRELTWEQTNWFMKFCDWLFVRGIVERASADALPVLKSRLESEPAPQPA